MTRAERLAAKRVVKTAEAEKAALRVFELKQLPKSEDEFKKVYRQYAKKAHPDSHMHEDYSDKSVKRVNKARDIIFNAIEEQNKPVVSVRFGDGIPQKAKVVDNPNYHSDDEDDVCNETVCSPYMTTLKWFPGLNIRIDSAEWFEVDEPINFEISNIFIRCV